jgi:hypothetical protein
LKNLRFAATKRCCTFSMKEFVQRVSIGEDSEKASAGRENRGDPVFLSWKWVYSSWSKVLVLYSMYFNDDLQYWSGCSCALQMQGSQLLEVRSSIWQTWWMSELSRNMSENPRRRIGKVGKFDLSAWTASCS